MSQELTKQRPNPIVEVDESPAPAAGGASPLAAQAAAYAQVAREALDDCERGIGADKELQRRGNKSGQ